MVESLVRRFVEVSDPPCPAAATGGEAPFFVSNSSSFSIHDPDLLVKGIALAYADSMGG
jgi:pantothenate kinase type III